MVSGQGDAIIAAEAQTLGAGVLVLIEHGETHEIRNTGTAPLQTLNFYVPSAYKESGDTLPAGEG